MKTERTALVTGSAVRVGAAIAERIAQLGFNIALHYNKSKEAVHALQRKITSQHKVQCRSFQADFAQIDSSISMFKDAVEYFTNIDILINSASSLLPSTFLNTSSQQLIHNLNIHLTNPLFLIQQFILQLPTNRPGVIINISDAMLLENKYHGYFDYEFTKLCLELLSDVINPTLPNNISVHTIRPGKIMPKNSNKSDTVKSPNYSPYHDQLEDFLVQIEHCLNMSFYPLSDDQCGFIRQHKDS